MSFWNLISDQMWRRRGAVFSDLTEGHLLLADGAVVREVFESRRDVSARLNRLQHICRGESAALLTQDDAEHLGFLVPDALRNADLPGKGSGLGGNTHSHTRARENVNGFDFILHHLTCELLNF